MSYHKIVCENMAPSLYCIYREKEPYIYISCIYIFLIQPCRVNYLLDGTVVFEQVCPGHLPCNIGPLQLDINSSRAEARFCDVPEEEKHALLQAACLVTRDDIPDETSDVIHDVQDEDAGDRKKVITKRACSDGKISFQIC